jgi:hypothetical protein
MIRIEGYEVAKRVVVLLNNAYASSTPIQVRQNFKRPCLLRLLYCLREALH